MPEISAASTHIAELCSENDADPVAVVGLLCLHALANADLARLEHLRRITERLQRDITPGK